ncbi:MAG: BirA family transcriptional regulator, partial [Nocardioidaceae bacterium]|nr:BirA family transcriptional regulator [Nocardioidaceae bacterium]
MDRAALATWPGAGRWRVEVLEESPSTNAALASRARAGEAPGLVLVAEHQTAGRGRLDRAWVTPPRAALTFSLLVSPVEVPLPRWPWLPLLTGVAVVDGVREATGVETSLKWP